MDPCVLWNSAFIVDISRNMLEGTLPGSASSSIMTINVNVSFNRLIGPPPITTLTNVLSDFQFGKVDLSMNCLTISSADFSVSVAVFTAGVLLCSLLVVRAGINSFTLLPLVERNVARVHS